jgi:hypothetical protein
MSYFLPDNYELNEYDVYCGRGNTSRNHMGNQRFRYIIDSNLDRYLHARNRIEKNVIITEIIEYVKSHGNFVKQDLETWKYYVISNTLARDKVSQAFRDTISSQKSNTACYRHQNQHLQQPITIMKRKQKQHMSEPKRKNPFLHKFLQPKLTNATFTLTTTNESVHKTDMMINRLTIDDIPKYSSALGKSSTISWDQKVDPVEDVKSYTALTINYNNVDAKRSYNKEDCAFLHLISTLFDNITGEHDDIDGVDPFDPVPI